MDLGIILTTANNFFEERLNSLKKDARYCILLNVGTPDWPAPFPALLYCFATIDLLGSLYGGDAKNSTGISERSRKYMTEVMKYTKEQSQLLQKVFRHKIVHLAQPKPAVKVKGDRYLWGYHHNDRGIHLRITPTNQLNEFLFQVSIWSLVEDIADSVFNPGGYLDRLKNEPNLQKNFEKAYNHIMNA